MFVYLTALFSSRILVAGRDGMSRLSPVPSRLLVTTRMGGNRHSRVEFIILGRVVRGRGLVGVTYVGVAYSKWIVVVLLCSCLLVTSHPSVSVRVTVSKSLCLCLCVTESGM